MFKLADISGFESLCGNNSKSCSIFNSFDFCDHISFVAEELACNVDPSNRDDLVAKAFAVIELYTGNEDLKDYLRGHLKEILDTCEYYLDHPYEPDEDDYEHDDIDVNDMNEL